MTPRHLMLAAGLATAAWFAFFADKSPPSSVVEPVTRSKVTSATATAAPANRATSDAAKREKSAVAKEPTILAIVPRDILMDGAQGETPVVALFDGQTWTPPPPPPPPPPKPVPPPPPTAPPLPFSYLGKKSEDSKWEVYLARGEQTYVVREQTVIDGTYRVDSIKPPVLSLTYLPLTQSQTLPIGGTD